VLPMGNAHPCHAPAGANMQHPLTPTQMRNEWLLNAVQELRRLFMDAGSLPVPHNIRFSVGHVKRRDCRVPGECWAPDRSTDGHTEIFISASWFGMAAFAYLSLCDRPLRGSKSLAGPS
jgi:hypothetical protein